MQESTIPFPPYDFYSTTQLIDAYAAAPARLAAVVHGLDEEALRHRARGPGTWSIQEIVLHVTDSEIQGVYRIRKAWAEPGTAFPGYDQDAWTAAFEHRNAGPSGREISLELFRALRRATVALFERAQPADWEAAHGFHPEFGRLTLRNLLELYADNGESHIAQILTIRERLGQRLDYPLLLSRRLLA
jgi:hypothetical protein